jgi:hypothetical protein
MFIITETPLLLTTFYFSLHREIPTYPIDANTTYSIAIMTLIYYFSLVFSLYLFGSIFFVNLFVNKIFQKEIQSIFRLKK